jgi:hypothetical protein
MEKYRWNGWNGISFDRYGGITGKSEIRELGSLEYGV